MDKDLYLTELRQCWMVALHVKNMPLQEMIRDAERADTMIWFLNPTLALDKDKRKKFEQDKKMLYALRMLQSVVEEFKPVGEEETKNG